MKSTTDHHREALDQALRIALGTSQPALRKQALARASLHLIHPKLILESALLTDSHPWRREALIVSDAFEAVTNGMEEPQVLEDLQHLPSESPFQAWRHLILAIHFYYEGLDEGLQAHLQAIPADSPVQPLVRTLAALVSGQPERLPPTLRGLANLVAQPDPLLHQWIQDIAEGLENDDEDLFWEAFADWLEHLAPANPNRAQAATRWAWAQLEWRDFDEQILLDLGASLWGVAESYRLAALGTVSWDAEGAALLWFRYLVLLIRDGAAEPEVIEARAWLDRFRDGAALDTSATDDASEIWNGLVRAWNTELAARGWSRHQASPLGRREAPTSPPSQSLGAQLDLFS